MRNPHRNRLQTNGKSCCCNEEDKQYLQFAKGLADSIQSTDGFKQHIFYDLGSYVTALNPGRELLREYNDVMSKTIRSNAATDSLYSNLYGKDVFIRIKNNSGITISDPSIHPAALRGMRKTAWWTATH